VERDDVELSGALVEDAQPQQVSRVQRVVGDRLLGDEDPSLVFARRLIVWSAVPPRK